MGRGLYWIWGQCQPPPFLLFSGISSWDLPALLTLCSFIRFFAFEHICFLLEWQICYFRIPCLVQAFSQEMRTRKKEGAGNSWKLFLEASEASILPTNTVSDQVKSPFRPGRTSQIVCCFIPLTHFTYFLNWGVGCVTKNVHGRKSFAAGLGIQRGFGSAPTLHQRT